MAKQQKIKTTLDRANEFAKIKIVNPPASPSGHAGFLLFYERKKSIFAD